jgi:hypothetical protein
MNQNLLVCCKNNQSSHALTQFIHILKRNARRSGKRGKAVGVRLCASGLGFGLWARFWTPLELPNPASRLMKRLNDDESFTFFYH